MSGLAPDMGRLGCGCQGQVDGHPSASPFTLKHLTCPIRMCSEKVTELVALGSLCSDPGSVPVTSVPYLTSRTNPVLGFLESCPSNMEVVTCILCLSRALRLCFC